MSRHKTLSNWIHDHTDIIVSFEWTMNSVAYDSYKSNALIIIMKIPLCKTMTKRHLECTPDDDVLIGILDEMYKDLLSASISH